VNYQLGSSDFRSALQASNTPIEVSLENNSVFWFTNQKIYGVNVEHKISDNFVVGGIP
jgi:cell surface protein SprA